MRRDEEPKERVTFSDSTRGKLFSEHVWSAMLCYTPTLVSGSCRVFATCCTHSLIQVHKYTESNERQLAQSTFLSRKLLQRRKMWWWLVVGRVEWVIDKRSQEQCELFTSLHWQCKGEVLLCQTSFLSYQWYFSLSSPLWLREGTDDDVDDVDEAVTVVYEGVSL